MLDAAVHEKLARDLASILEDDTVNDMRNRGLVEELADEIAKRLIARGWA